MPKLTLAFPTRARRFTLDDLLVHAEGQAAFLRGRDTNPYPSGHKALFWNEGWDAAAIRLRAFVWGFREPTAENPYELGEYDDGCGEAFDLGQRIGIRLMVR